MKKKACLLASVLLLLAACDTEPAVPSKSESATARALPDAWVGHWSGPEGTYLHLEGDSGVYKLTIANLDGPLTFEARAVNDRIQFTRDGHVESIEATDGAATGMKWLLEKENCLTIRYGEGYCRD